MKRRAAKPSESVMRFFTPDLCRRFNSADPVEADAADADWETAVGDYRAHLDRLHDRFPLQVRKLATLNHHDAEVLAFEE